MTTTKVARVMGTDSHGQKHRGHALSRKELESFRERSKLQREEIREKKRKRAARQLAQMDYGHMNVDNDAYLPGRDHNDNDDDWEDIATFAAGDGVTTTLLDDVLKGRKALDLSNHGGEYEEIVKGHLLLLNKHAKSRKRVDTRNRRDAIAKRIAAFAVQMPLMVEAYMLWYYKQGKEPYISAAPPTYDDEKESKYPSVTKLDMFEASEVDIPLYASLASIGASFVREGLIPCAPVAPTVAFTIRTLELFRTTSLRCPRLSIQAFVKSLCDLHGIPFRSYYSTQFSIAFDTYLDILDHVDKKVNAALGRDEPGWRLKHACAPCTYRLHGEPALKFSMFVTMDGNDSLKRLARRDETKELVGGRKELGVNHERFDPREVSGEYYLTREEVDKWAAGSTNLIPSKGDDTDPNACDDRWKNMANERTARMWGIFDETGIFLVLCRHGHVLLVMDMVRSGEQSKYALAAVDHLLDAFGKDLGIGYDIGCKFGSTLRKSSLGPRASELNASCLVGSFHGHAHNRRCQLTNLATYVEGLGLEDLEGCEPFFSQSNNLSTSTRHASIFHRRQKIHCYIKHMDREDTYLSLSSMLVKSYKRALEIIACEGALLKQMQEHGLGNDKSIFQQWLAEEHSYLANLTREPMVETLKMEYYSRLQILYHLEGTLEEARRNWNILTPSNTPSTPDQTLRNETKRRQLLERHRRELETIHNLELDLNIKPEARWIPEDDEWKNAREQVSLRKYRLALDRLEGLVVARLFELTKANMSQTGYKMRQHIGKALKARSQAIRSALDEYNTAAKAVNRVQLTWDQVVQYTQLADFDLLSDTRDDIRDRPWATPANRSLLDHSCKVDRAREEIKRLNIEIPRLTTHIRDEEAFLKAKASSIRTSQPLIAHMLDHRLLSFARKNDIHLARLTNLLKVPGFSGTLNEGVSIERDPHLTSHTTPRPQPSPATFHDIEGDEEDDEEDEEEAERVAFQVMEMSLDDR